MQEARYSLKKYISSRTTWEGRPERVKAPYAKGMCLYSNHLSKAGHEESCLNPGGPSPKAKYQSATDSA